MTHVFVGASASTDVAPCHSMEDWAALLAALERGDSEAVIAITTNTRPKLVPVAQLHVVQPNPPKTMAEAAASFWAKRGKSPRARAIDASGDPIVRAVRS